VGEWQMANYLTGRAASPSRPRGYAIEVGTWDRCLPQTSGAIRFNRTVWERQQRSLIPECSTPVPDDIYE